jgi:hypothetical protein
MLSIMNCTPAMVLVVVYQIAAMTFWITVLFDRRFDGRRARSLRRGWRTVTLIVFGARLPYIRQVRWCR